MGRVAGWLFDAYVQGGEAVIWIKAEDGRAIRLRDSYSPFFHVEPRGPAAEDEIMYRLAECPDVKAVRIEAKKTSLVDPKPKRLVRVEACGTGPFRGLVKALERHPMVAAVYNASLRHIQQYLFTRLKVEPTSRVSADFDGEWLSKVERIDDSGAIEPPPFTVLRFTVKYDCTGRGRAIKGIRASFGGEEEAFTGSTGGAAEAFMAYLREKDPDLLVSPKCDGVAYPLLKEALEKDGCAFLPGRCEDREQIRRQGSAAGRVFLGGTAYGFSLDDRGVAGLAERARFSFLPMGLATRWLSNRSIDSRNCFELIQRGYAIPRQEYFEEVRALSELAERDRGGIIMTPEAGRLHENVAALDFDSQYPNIILKDGISYEGGRGAASDEEGAFKLIPAVIGPWLARRMALKRLKRALPEGSAARAYCEQRVDALKMILVTQYGIAGCCRNRFGNVVAFEEINRRSREAMIRAKRVAEGRGFRILYGNVDALFVSRDGAGRCDYEGLAAEIASVTGLPMSLDKHFRLIAFLPLKGDGSSSAISRYFGITFDGKIEARGIEMRRGDVPEFVRSFQEGLIARVLGHGGAREAFSSGVDDGIAFVKEALREVRSGEVPADRLVIRKRMRKGIGEYAASVPQRAAAVQLMRGGAEVEVGDEVPFVYVDRGHPNPSCRVAVPSRFASDYDREAYAKMVIEAASSVFSGIGIRLGERLEGPPITLDAWIGRISEH